MRHQEAITQIRKSLLHLMSLVILLASKRTCKAKLDKPYVGLRAVDRERRQRHYYALLSSLKIVRPIELSSVSRRALLATVFCAICPTPTSTHIPQKTLGLSTLKPFKYYVDVPLQMKKTFQVHLKNWHLRAFATRCQ